MSILFAVALSASAGTAVSSAGQHSTWAPDSAHPHLRARGVRALVVSDPTGDLWNSIAATAATVAWRGAATFTVRVAAR